MIVFVFIAVAILIAIYRAADRGSEGLPDEDQDSSGGSSRNLDTYCGS